MQPHRWSQRAPSRTVGLLRVSRVVRHVSISAADAKTPPRWRLHVRATTLKGHAIHARPPVVNGVDKNQSSGSIGERHRSDRTISDGIQTADAPHYPCPKASIAFSRHRGRLLDSVHRRDSIAHDPNEDANESTSAASMPELRRSSPVRSQFRIRNENASRSMGRVYVRPTMW
jgi:hypothetical protein